MGRESLLAHARSLRDNPGYRASFSRRNRPLYQPSGDHPMTTIVDHHQVHCHGRAGRLETIPCRR